MRSDPWEDPKRNVLSKERDSILKLLKKVRMKLIERNRRSLFIAGFYVLYLPKQKDR